MKRMLRVAALLLVASVAVSGCGDQESSESKDLVLQMTPTLAYFIGGSTAGCADLYEAQFGELTKSIAPNRLFYRTFALEWKSAERKFYITRIRATVRGSQIAGGEFRYDMSEDEIEALVGDSQASVDPGEIVVSSSEDRVSYPACGFNIGGVQYISGDQDPTPFTAIVAIEVVGYSERADGSDPLPVRKTLYVDAEWF